MKRTLAIVMAALCLASCASVDLEELACKMSQKSENNLDIEDYKGSAYLQGLSAMAEVAQSDCFRDKLEGYLDSFASGELNGYGSFISYKVGGAAMAEQAYLHGKPEYLKATAAAARQEWDEQFHTPDGMILPRWGEILERNAVFVDCAFAVCSFYIYAGLAEGNDEYVSCAANMATRMYDNLEDSSTGLVHQARAMSRLKEGELSEDCWSRGNGWLSLGFSYLLDKLPADHPMRGEVDEYAAKFFSALLKYQDADGLWHQEITWPDSYPEISGSALILRGIGSAIQAGVLPRSAEKDFMRGIRGMLDYIDADGNIGNTCSGCLAYLNATKADYASHPYYTNEAHAFGPALLAFAKAIEMGHRKLSGLDGTGAALEGRIPACYARYIEERKGDFAWENDKVAYRIYSKQVTNKGFSGIDLWAKSVEYPIVDKWYAANAIEEGAYHIDKGEGCDFYQLGANRGIGGTGVLVGDSLYVADPFDEYEIIENTPEHIEFVIKYRPYPAGDDEITESKKISMDLGSQFFTVQSTVESRSGSDIRLAVGLTTFGAAQKTADKDKGVLYTVETLNEKDGTIACAVVADPQQVADFCTSGDNELMCFDLKSGSSVTYEVGAGWSKDLRFDPRKLL